MARRSGLGKGLSALIPNEVVGDRSSSLREVPIGSIKPNPRQPRVNFDEDTMSSLAASIRELGVLQPVLVRQIGSAAADDFELIAGERRWRAARRAGLQTIPVLVLTSDETQSLEQALVENLHRQDLNVLEEAAAYQQLIDEFGYTHDQVAKRVGKSRTAVTNTLRLLQLPSGVQRLLWPKGRSVPATPEPCSGLPIAGIRRCWPSRWWPTGSPSGPSRTWCGSTTAGERPTLRQAEPGHRYRCHPTAINPAGPAAPRRLPPPGILELEELLSSHLNTRVKVDLTSKRGKVVVEFATLEDLERIYKLMVGRAAPSPV